MARHYFYSDTYDSCSKGQLFQIVQNPMGNLADGYVGWNCLETYYLYYCFRGNLKGGSYG